MAYIDDRIAELEQRIAEKKAYQRMHPSHKYASTWDYVAEGDRSGFDRMDAEEAAYRNMLAQQAQQLNVLKAQQDFNAEQNYLNRKNAKEIASMSRTDANIAKLDAIEKELNNLIITKQTLDAQNIDSRVVNARIEQIYKNYPTIERPQLQEYDPETDVNYVLAKSREMNYVDNAGENELEDMLATVKNYRTPEAAKERVRLEREIIKRNKAAQFKKQLDAEIERYWKEGIMGDLMLELGIEEAGVEGNRYLLQGKKIIRRQDKKGSSTTTPTNTPTFQTT